MRVCILLMFTIVGVAGCRDVTRPPARALASNFRIVLADPAYAWDGYAVAIDATVTNTSRDQDFYANVGDGINGALEQTTIFAARGTNAVIERRVSSSDWVDANTGQLDEGSRFVVLRAGKNYRLRGSVAPNASGIYRIRLDYFTSNDDPPASAFHAYSATFRVP